MVAKKNNITYIRNSFIEKAKWDRCIANAGNSLIYATALYLDTMSKSWDALILNDYEVVMPLTYNKKFGIYYLYQPFTCASLGIFGNSLTKEIIELFLKAIPAHFKYADIYLNYANSFTIQDFELIPRANYTLSLNKSYENIFKGYRNSYRQIISRNNATHSLAVKRNINYALVIDLAIKKMQHINPFKKDDIKRFKNLCKIFLQDGQVKTYGVYENSTLLASGIFFIYKDRAHYIMAGNTEDGRQKSASHILIDAFIKDHADTKIILDFEGSNIPGIAFFFKGFNPEKEIYPALKFNLLNRVQRIFKK